jgi:hypothetical protein
MEEPRWQKANRLRPFAALILAALGAAAIFVAMFFAFFGRKAINGHLGK